MPENFVRKPPFLHHDVPLTNSNWLPSQPNRHPPGHLHPAAHHRCPHPPQLPISIAQGSRNHTAEETPKPQLVAGSIGHPLQPKETDGVQRGGDDLSSPRCLDPIKLYLKKTSLKLPPIQCWSYPISETRLVALFWTRKTCRRQVTRRCWAVGLQRGHCAHGTAP